MGRKFVKGQVKVEFQSKHPHITCWLHIEYPEHQPPEKLFKALRDIGWTNEGCAPPSPLNGCAEEGFSRKGTGLFGGWTPAERRKFMKDARAALYMQGFQRVAVHKLSFAELI